MTRCVGELNRPRTYERRAALLVVALAYAALAAVAAFALLALNI